jgi:hypothetical protein
MTFTQTDINVPVDGTITPAKIASGNFYFDTDTLYVDATNNRVGLNNSSPVEMLTIGSTSDTNVRAQFLSSTSGANTIQFGDGTGAGAYSGYINYTHSDDVLAFATGGSERMRLSGGNVGIGVSPVTTLDVKGASDLVASFRSSTNNGNTSEAKIRAVDSDSSHVATFLFQGYEHRFQNASGTERMRINSSGHVTMPSQPAFLVRPSSTQANIPIAATTTILLGTEVFDQGSNFASNTFTAPVTGRYQFDAAVYCLTVDSATEYVQLALRTSNRLYYYIFSTNTLSQDAFYMSFPLSVLADMDAGDTATLELQLPNSGTAQMDVNAVSSFSGYLVA